MTAWNDAFDGSLDWSEVSFLNMIRAAILERANALRGPPAVPAAVAAGDDVQAGIEAPTSVIAGLQNALAEVADFTDVFYAEGYCDPAATYEAAGAFPPLMGFAGVRAACGFATAAKYRRKRPREIDDPAASADTQGNAAADGQRARLTVAPYGLWGRQSGAWVPTTAADGPPDVLDTDAAAPLACLPSATTFGVLAEGDYIGPWLFAELRDMCNKMVWTQQTGGALLGSGLLRTGTGTGATWTGAKAAAESAYDAATPAASSALASSIGAGSLSGGTYTATLTRGGGDVGPVNDPAGVARTVEWYITTDAPAGHGQDFWDNGTDVVFFGFYHLYHSLSADTSIDPLFAYPDDLGPTARPPWPAAPTGGVPSKGEGWRVASYFDNKLLMKWDAAGGFAYTLAT